MKNDWDSMLNITQEAIENGKVDANLLRNLRGQVTDGAKHDNKHLPILQSLEKIVIDDDMVQRMSKCKTEKELILRFYEELQERFPKEKKLLLEDIFSEVTEWIKQQ